jgi:hypothetical protein
MTTEQFITYCWDFYGPGGIYPMQIDQGDMQRAVEILHTESCIPIVYDSVDREQVREILHYRQGKNFLVDI